METRRRCWLVTWSIHPLWAGKAAAGKFAYGPCGVFWFTEMQLRINMCMPIHMCIHIRMQAAKRAHTLQQQQQQHHRERLSESESLSAAAAAAAISAKINTWLFSLFRQTKQAAAAAQNLNSDHESPKFNFGPPSLSASLTRPFAYRARHTHHHQRQWRRTGRGKMTHGQKHSNPL